MSHHAFTKRNGEDIQLKKVVSLFDDALPSIFKVGRKDDVSVLSHCLQTGGLADGVDFG